MNKKFLVIILCLATFVLGYGASKYKCLGALFETKEDHLSQLTYTMPEPGFYHDKDDIGVIIEDNKVRVGAKSYKRLSDMSEITIWEFEYDKEDIDDFKKNVSEIVTFPEDKIPEGVEAVLVQSDSEYFDDDITDGTYYRALVIMQDHETTYHVDVVSDNDPKTLAEDIISTFKIDETQKDEFVKR